jgi:hypothetical protein
MAKPATTNTTPAPAAGPEPPGLTRGEIAEKPLSPIERARKDLRELDENITGLVGRRRERLLSGAANSDIAAVDAALDEARKARQIEADRIEALEIQHKREIDERRLGERAEKIKIVEADFALRDDCARRAGEAIKQLDAAVREWYLISRRLRSAWDWRNPDIGALMLGEVNIELALQSELYRRSGKPPVTGGIAPPQDGPSLPGAKAPSLQLMGLPEQIEPLDVAIARASTLASELMRGGTTTGGSDGLQRGSSGRTLPALLNRMNELANGDVNDPTNEAEYNSIVSELAQIDQPQQGAVA